MLKQAGTVLLSPAGPPAPLRLTWPPCLRSGTSHHNPPGLINVPEPVQTTYRLLPNKRIIWGPSFGPRSHIPGASSLMTKDFGPHAGRQRLQAIPWHMGQFLTFRFIGPQIPTHQQAASSSTGSCLFVSTVPPKWHSCHPFQASRRTCLLWLFSSVMGPPVQRHHRHPLHTRNGISS